MSFGIIWLDIIIISYHIILENHIRTETMFNPRDRVAHFAEIQAEHKSPWYQSDCTQNRDHYCNTPYFSVFLLKDYLYFIQKLFSCFKIIGFLIGLFLGFLIWWKLFLCAFLLFIYCCAFKLLLIFKLITVGFNYFNLILPLRLNYFI